MEYSAAAVLLGAGMARMVVVCCSALICSSARAPLLDTVLIGSPPPDACMAGVFMGWVGRACCRLAGNGHDLCTLR